MSQVDWKENNMEWNQVEEPADPFSLDSICSSRHWSSVKAVVYGVPGIGKTSFAATFPSPILIRTEDGASALDIPTFPKVVETVQELMKCLDVLDKQRHGFRTVIIDSLDWLEGMVWHGVCAKHGKKHIEDFAYGKGYVIVDEAWRHITGRLDRLQAKGMNVIAICHSAITTIMTPDSDDYMSYGLKLHKRGAAIWTEWADELLFINYDKSIVRTGGENSKLKAQGNGNRIIYTASRPAYLAKSRYPLPEEILIGQDKTWAAFHECLSEASGGQYTNK